MSIWIWIAIIALVVYLMFRRHGKSSCCGGAAHNHSIEPQEAGSEEKMIEAKEGIAPEADRAEMTAEESDETKAA
jgi:hypothetical protein